MIKKLLAILLFSLPCLAANDVYLANVAAGGNTGVDCADAKVYTYFNSSGNWSASPSGILIGPDTTVHLCGTIGSATVGTGITLLTSQSSGTSGHPVTILFESGAVLQSPDFGAGGAAIRLDNSDWITVDGGGTGNANLGTFTPNGIIQATLSGTTGGSCTGGACNKNNGSTGISATTTNHITIKNLKIQNMYLRSSFSDQAPDWATYFCIHASPSSDLLINNNYMIESGEILAPNGNNIEIKNNYLAQTNHELSLGAGATSWSNTYVHDNHFGPMDHWDAGTPFPYHHDGIHIFPGGPGFYLSVYIYNNTFDGDIGSVSVTGWIYAEQTSMTGGNLYVFNNTETTTPGRSAPALFGLYSGTILVANNTLFQSFYTGGGVALDVGLADATVNVHKNNIIWGQSYDAKIQSGTTVNGTAAFDYNIYVDGSASGNTDNFTYPGNDTQSLGTWKTTALPGAATHDAHSQLISPAAILLNSDGSLQSSSPARNVGVNLFSVCNGQAIPGLGALCLDKNGAARPTVSAWDAGATQFGGAPPTAGTPTFSPVAGTYSGAQAITISTSSGGAIICYSTTVTPATNGTTGCTTGTLYAGPVAITTTSTLSAVAGGTGFTDSSVGSAAYTINNPPAAPFPAILAGLYGTR